jgi:hypothetical protein
MSQAYGVSKDQITACGINGCNSSLTLADLPAGSYAIFAKVRADGTPTTGAARWATCTLSAETDTDQAQTLMPKELDAAQPSRVAMLPLQLIHTFGATGQVVLTCAPSSAQFYDGKITAIRVGQVTQTIAP